MFRSIWVISYIMHKNRQLQYIRPEGWQRESQGTAWWTSSPNVTMWCLGERCALRFSLLQPHSNHIFWLSCSCSFKDHQTEKVLSELFDKPRAYGLTATHESTHVRVCVCVCAQFRPLQCLRSTTSWIKAGAALSRRSETHHGTWVEEDPGCLYFLQVCFTFLQNETNVAHASELKRAAMEKMIRRPLKSAAGQSVRRGRNLNRPAWCWLECGNKRPIRAGTSLQAANSSRESSGAESHYTTFREADVQDPASVRNARKRLLQQQVYSKRPQHSTAVYRGPTSYQNTVSLTFPPPLSMFDRCEQWRFPGAACKVASLCRTYRMSGTFYCPRVLPFASQSLRTHWYGDVLSGNIGRLTSTPPPKRYKSPVRVVPQAVVVCIQHLTSLRAPVLN